MKVKITFNLPEETEEYLIYNKASDFHFAITQFYQDARALSKYSNDDEEIEQGETMLALYEKYFSGL